MEQLIEGGSENMATVFAGRQIERERFLGAGHSARPSGYANGTRPKKMPGTVRLEVAGPPFYPQALERGRRSCRAVMLAVAEMYIKGVSTRDAEAVMREFGLESLSSSFMGSWMPRNEIRYLLLDAPMRKSERVAWCATPPCSR